MKTVLLLNINQTFRKDMLRDDLYQATRGFWRVSAERRKEVEYAVAVSPDESLGIYRIREIYRVERWDKASMNEDEMLRKPKDKDKNKWKFSGKIADGTVRKKYIGKSVDTNKRNPIRYVDDLNDL